MIEIKFSGNNFKDLRLEIQEFAVAHLNFKPEEHLPSIPKSSTYEPESSTAEAPIKRKPGRQPGWRKPVAPAESAPVAIPVDQTEPATVAPEVPEVEVINKESCAKLILDVNAKFGIDRARECLLAFKAQKLGDLDPKQYVDFTDHCRKVLA